MPDELQYYIYLMKSVIHRIHQRGRPSCPPALPTRSRVSWENAHEQPKLGLKGCGSFPSELYLCHLMSLVTSCHEFHALGPAASIWELAGANTFSVCGSAVGGTCDLLLPLGTQGLLPFEMLPAIRPP